MIINSLLDTDLYKITLMQLIFHRFRDTTVEYQFKCRTRNIDLIPFLQDIKQEIAHFCSLRFSHEDLGYLKKFPYFQNDFLHFLQTFKLSNNHIHFNPTHPFGITIKGPWHQTVLLGIPILAIISEIYMRHQSTDNSLANGKLLLQNKINLIKNDQSLKKFSLIDFGTRRRFSWQWHREIITILMKELPNNFSGTSNAYFAREFDLPLVGTMSHEYIQACQVLSPNLRDSQKYALTTWTQEYGKMLNIALTDTYNLATFLRDFDHELSNLFTGVRLDSGDPFSCGDRILNHYQTMGTETKKIKLVFSDNLCFPTAIKLFKYFTTRTNTSFGIGTNLTNNLGHPPIQIVIKMTECNGKPVAKISDTPEKVMCKDPNYLKHLKEVFEIE